MNPTPKMTAPQAGPNPTEVAHRDLTNILLNGRILINGQPPTGNELGLIVRGEQLLFEKAMKLDAAQALAAAKMKATKPKIVKLPAVPPEKG